MKQFSKVFLSLLAVLVAVSPNGFSQNRGDEEYRDFVGSNGKTIQAILVDRSNEKKKAVLKLKSGQRVVVDYDTLSEGDQEFVKEWSKDRAVFLQQCQGLTVRELLELRGYESFKFKLDNNSMIVEGELNGNPAKFLIDTGAHSSVLHVQSAEKMGCRVGPMDQKIRGIGGEAPAAWTEVTKFDWANRSLKTRICCLRI